MRAGGLMLAAVMWLATAIPALAGLYNPAEPDKALFSSEFPKFYSGLVLLRSIADEKPAFDNPMRLRHILQANSAPRVIPATWPAEHKLGLSACLIRRAKYLEAIEILRAMTRQDPGDFLALANLATAYQLLGQLTQASDCHQQALKAWPENWDDVRPAQRKILQTMGWEKIDYYDYRRAETYHSKLLASRRREPAKPPQTLDDLFDGVRFVADSGNYEAGKLADSERKKLPKDAVEIVQQLLYWFPNDPRLYWMLGELYNARGDPKRGDVLVARKIFDELAGFKGPYHVPELVAHLNTLKAYTPPESKEDGADSRPTTDSQPGELGFDWRHLLVSFVAGVIVAVFGWWQIQEMRRRRQRAMSDNPADSKTRPRA